MNKVYIPASSPDDWAKFLAEPVKHWKTGYSARTLAHSWHEADGFPTEVRAALEPSFPSIELLLALPEHKVSIPGGTRSSQNDIWALARCQGHLISIAVEGKVSEPFGPTVSEWLAHASPGKATRLRYLQDLLGLTTIPGDIRYQLLHRTASALIEAQRFNATHAVMLVHSFSRTNEWHEDYAAFVRLFEASVDTTGTTWAALLGGVQLHFAWVRGDPAYLAR